jgi:hypothetical protein
VELSRILTAAETSSRQQPPRHATLNTPMNEPDANLCAALPIARHEKNG